MKSISSYSTLVLVTIGVFANFVACGSKMYQVSVEKDVDPALISEDATNINSPNYGIHATAGWSELPIRFKTSEQLSEDQLLGLNRAIETWEIAVGQDLFLYEGADARTGDTFNDLYSSLEDFENGHYLDQNWSKTGKPEMVLATTIWDNSRIDANAIQTADIRFNAENYEIGDSLVLFDAPANKEIVDMETLALHELGHLLGLSHVDPDIDPESIMNPSIFIGAGLYSRSVSKGDIERIQRIYDCMGDACDVEVVYLEILQRVANPEYSAH